MIYKQNTTTERESSQPTSAAKSMRYAGMCALILVTVVLSGCGDKEKDVKTVGMAETEVMQMKEKESGEVMKEESHAKIDNVTQEIADGVYSYTLDGSYYSMFVVTDEGVIAIESINSKHAQGMVAGIQSVTDQPIKYLLHSHNHWDHSSGGQVFKDAGATIVAHSEAIEWMKANTGKDMIIPDESWDGDRKDITLGGVTVELRYLGMNHGLGMTVFTLPETKTAYIADLVTPNRVLFTVVPDFNIREWERSIEEIIALDFEKAVYSHNDSANASEGGTKQDAIDNLAFIRDLRNAIYAEFEKGTSPESVPSVVRVPKYEEWAMYDEWLEMNAWRLLLDDFMGPFPWKAENVQ